MMSSEDLDRAYFSVCDAMRELDEDETVRFLARLSLLLLSAQTDLLTATKTIGDARDAL